MEPGYLPTITRHVWIFFWTLVSGLLLHLIGFSTTYWTHGTRFHTGLWRAYVNEVWKTDPYTASEYLVYHTVQRLM